MTSQEHEPATVEQLINAMMALGVWDGQNTPQEREEESRRLGAQAYRFSLCNALLGMVQAQAVRADQASDLSASYQPAFMLRR